MKSDNPPYGHYEKIKCPECDTVQEAKVIYTVLWNMYCHDCIQCGYTIMESEWNEMEEVI
tara:strand:- start:121 stop:300 length:180 start_codon:yes stop_codon:yes gene_type:complete